MKRNYLTPQVILKVYDQDVITTSTPETTAVFEELWLED